MPSARLGLGAAQFGMPYGLSNPQHRVGVEEVERILDAAWKRGVDLIDTAAAYGDSESVIGNHVPEGARFRIVTKAIPLRIGSVTEKDVAHVVAKVRASLGALRVDRVDALLVHEARDLLVPGGERLFAALKSLRDGGSAGRLGVSVYDPEILDEVLDRYPLELVQLPLNVFDQRFARGDLLSALARRGIEVHVRSIFLKGLLLRRREDVPTRFTSACTAIERFHEAARRAGLEPAAAALAFAARLPGVGCVVVGTDSLAMFEANSRAWDAAQAWKGTMDFDSLALDDPMVTDPRRWNN